MTVEEKIRQLLEEHGVIWKDHRDAILEASKQSTQLEVMKDRWEDDVDGHFGTTIFGTWLAVCNVALDWIDENLPQAFFRPLIAGEIKK
jgi:hypothetical protein